PRGRGPAEHRAAGRARRDLALGRPQQLRAVPPVARLPRRARAPPRAAGGAQDRPRRQGGRPLRGPLVTFGFGDATRRAESRLVAALGLAPAPLPAELARAVGRVRDDDVVL